MKIKLNKKKDITFDETSNFNEYVKHNNRKSKMKKLVVIFFIIDLLIIGAILCFIFNPSIKELVITNINKLLTKF